MNARKRSVALLIACSGMAVETLLLLRIWAQASAQPLDTGFMEALYSVTDDLAAWPAPLTGKEPLHVTGVIDYAVLLAAELYFVAMLTLLVFSMAAMGSWTLFGRLKPRQLPAFVKLQMEPPRRRPVWQPTRSSRVIGVRYLVPVKRRDLPPAHTREGLGH